MNLLENTQPYLEQHARWPNEGRHIMASYDDTSIVVYQAYRPSIGRWAVEHQRFGGEWSFERMSWIKPNFLWMMYRCGWAQKPGQEVVLAVRLRREGFDAILEQAVHSSHVAEVYGEHENWRRAVKHSNVRLQWDPDHDPHGNKLARRAIQLGLRDSVLREYANSWCLGIEDISAFVREQHAHVRAHRLDLLQIPSEDVYPVNDAQVAARLGVEAL